MSLEKDADALTQRLQEQAALGQAPTKLDKLEATSLALRAVGAIVMCAVGLIVLGFIVYACAAS